MTNNTSVTVRTGNLPAKVTRTMDDDVASKRLEPQSEEEFFVTPGCKVMVEAIVDDGSGDSVDGAALTGEGG